MRWYTIPVEDELPAEEYVLRAERFHRVAVQLPPAIGARFEAMAADALEIASRKAHARLEAAPGEASDVSTCQRPRDDRQP